MGGGADVGCDDRAFLMSAVSSMDVVTSVAFFYPRLFPIHNLADDEMPRAVRCTIDKISDDGVYLLENGLYLFMYIGLAADPAWIQEVFGVQTAAQIDIDKTRLQDRDTPASQRVRKVIDQIRAERSRYCMRLVLVRQRDQLKLDIASNSSILSGDHVFFSAPSLHQVQTSEQDEQDPLCVVCLSNP